MYAYVKRITAIIASASLSNGCPDQKEHQQLAKLEIFLLAFLLYYVAFFSLKMFKFK